MTSILSVELVFEALNGMTEAQIQQAAEAMQKQNKEKDERGNVKTRKSDD